MKFLLQLCLGLAVVSGVIGQQAPMINGTNHTFVYYYYSPRPYAFRTSNNNWLPVFSKLRLNDTDSPMLSTAYLTFDADTYDDDLLLYQSENTDISGYFASDTGTLSMFGSATVADWQAALRAVVYRASNKLSLKQRPNRHDRYVTIEVYDASGLRDKAVQHILLETARTVITDYNPLTISR